MPLNLTGGGSAKPYIRYMASTSTWEKSCEGGKEPFEFNKAVFDLANIKTGWCAFNEGQAPEWVMDESLEKTAPRPEGENWKRGFKVNIFSEGMFGGEPVREWATNSAGGTMAIGDLYAEYEKVAKDGALPVVEYSGAKPVKVGRGNTTVPQFSIVKMVDTPQQFQSDDPSLTQGQADNGDDLDEF